jgi:hypothetical protein
VNSLTVTLLYSSDYGHIDEGYVVDTPIGVGGTNQYPVDFSGNVPFKAPHDLPPGLALRGAPRDVAAGALIDAHAHHADKVQGLGRASRLPT